MKNMELLLSIKLDNPEKISTNRMYSGMHWTKRNAIKDVYHYAMLSFRKHKITEYPVTIKYTFTWKSKALDSLNCAFSAKMCEDGLRACGVLVDDNPKYVVESSLRTIPGPSDTIQIDIYK